MVDDIEEAEKAALQIGVLAQAVKAGVPDVAARAAMDLATLREPGWAVPPTVDAFVDVLRLSGRLPG